eukprot:m.131412 g.131412  ORF g.131412 m.131412 type:complete len:746 (+) comp29545_c0_seq1:104-2341(+)
MWLRATVVSCVQVSRSGYFPLLSSALTPIFRTHVRTVVTMSERAVKKLKSTRETGLGFRWDLSATEITSTCQAIIVDYDTCLKSIASIDSSRISVDTVLRPWAWMDGDAATRSVEVTLPAYCGASGDTPDATARRAASSEAKKALKSFWDRIYEREDLFKVLSQLNKQIAEEGGEHIDPICRRLLTAKLAKFKRTGAELKGEERQKFSQMRQRCGEICSMVEQNITENTTKIAFSAEELEGVDPHFLQILTQKDGKYLVGLKAPESSPIMRQATNEETRKLLGTALHKKCPENLPLFAELIHLRYQSAVLLGYPDHAAYILDEKMASTTTAVDSFVEGILSKLRGQAQIELNELRNVKRKHVGDVTAEFQSWDKAFYDRLQREEKFSLDETKVAEYFPMDHVLSEIMAIYSEVLGLTFSEISETDGVSAGISWHEDAKLYSVHDSKTNELLGHFFLDLFPRPGKYGHQCVIPIRPSYLKQNGQHQTPCVCLVGNNPMPGIDRPSLLRHSEVKTLFHEFGHVCHGVCTNSQFSLFSWAWSAVPYHGGVEYDFLEAPSMMMELWCWERDVIKRLSSHYSNTGDCKQLPDETIESLALQRTHNRALNQLRYFAMAKADVTMHKANACGDGKDAAKLVKVFDDVLLEDGLVTGVEGGHYITSWYHPVQGYDVGYYGYGWSEAFAADMFTVFQAAPHGCFDKEQGRRYRDSILAPGATIDGAKMLETFLGRQPSNAPFLKSLGISAATDQ